jgi:hypothetical protein
MGRIRQGGDGAAHSGGAFMLEITDGERAFLTEMRGLGVDAKGSEILVGLTVEESREYIKYLNSRMIGAHPDSETSDRYLALNDKYEVARHAVLAPEIVARDDISARH